MRVAFGSADRGAGAPAQLLQNDHTGREPLLGALAAGKTRYVLVIR
jgi:hypothetical protein